MGVLEATEPVSKPKRARKIATKDQLIERREKVATLVTHGLTQHQIAKELGVSQSTIRDDMKHVRRMWREQLSQSYEDHVARQLARYQELAKALRPGIQAGDWKAIDTGIRLADREARLLGVDMPQKTEVHISIEALDEKIKELEQKAAVPEEEIFDAEIVEE